ncbi:MAG TPA: MaoC family dehydratase [Acidisphaera sp.]|nr:MaoC family dehydratase [Acidisphaera sp.]
MPKLYLEDFTPGSVLRLGSRTVSEEEILDFAHRWDPQTFHTDPQAARGSIYGGLIASGWHTCAMAMRAMCDGYLLDAASLGSPGVDEVRWLAPVRPGDTLTFTMEVMEMRPSGSKPDRGLVRSRWLAHNQHGTQVLSMTGWGMFARRPANA